MATEPGNSARGKHRRVDPETWKLLGSACQGSITTVPIGVNSNKLLAEQGLQFSFLLTLPSPPTLLCPYLVSWGECWAMSWFDTIATSV